MKTALVVGGSKGLGLEIAKKFKARGDRTIVLSRNKNDWNDEVILADLSDLKSLQGSMQYIRENQINFNYIVFSQKNRSAPKDFSLETQISLSATQYLTEQLIPNYMADSAAVVFLGSPSGSFVTLEQPIEYHMSKAALEQLAKYYAVCYGKYGITFNTILPGTIAKNSNHEFLSNNQRVADFLKNITPLKKIGSAEDVANAVAFFCSDQATFITGHSMLLDGGRSLEGHESLARRLMEIS